jgi:hypothetical protein
MLLWGILFLLKWPLPMFSMMASIVFTLSAMISGSQCAKLPSLYLNANLRIIRLKPKVG